MCCIVYIVVTRTTEFLLQYFLFQWAIVWIFRFVISAIKFYCYFIIIYNYSLSHTHTSTQAHLYWMADDQHLPWIANTHLDADMNKSRTHRTPNTFSCLRKCSPRIVWLKISIWKSFVFGNEKDPICTCGE